MPRHEADMLSSLVTEHQPSQSINPVSCLRRDGWGDIAYRVWEDAEVDIAMHRIARAISERGDEMSQSLKAVGRLAQHQSMNGR